MAYDDEQKSDDQKSSEKYIRELDNDFDFDPRFDDPPQPATAPTSVPVSTVNRQGFHWSIGCEQDYVRELVAVLGQGSNSGSSSSNPNDRYVERHGPANILAKWHGSVRDRHGSGLEFLRVYLEVLELRWWSFNGREEMSEGERREMRSWVEGLARRMKRSNK